LLFDCAASHSDIQRGTRGEARDPLGTVNSTSDYTLKNLCRSYFKDANIDLQVYSVTC
jgi:hypothetical protein